MDVAKQFLRSCRAALGAVALFSGALNLLMLTGALFMLEVYDRVLPSRSVPTLVGLMVLAAIAFTAQGAMEMIRGRLLSRVGALLDEELSGPVFRTVARMPVLTGNRGNSLQPMRDLDSVRQFAGGAGPAALFDLPWMPLYLGIVYLLHPLLAATALAGAIVLVCLTLATDMLTRKALAEASRHVAAREKLARAVSDNAEIVVAMRMTDNLERHWREVSTANSGEQLRASDVASTFGALSKVLRIALQSAMLAVGAVLVIGGDATPGVMIAGSLLGARALAPVDGAIAHWRGFVAARQSWARLAKFLQLVPEPIEPLSLPAPHLSLSVDAVSVVAPGDRRVLVSDVTFSLSAGQVMGVLGSSASGKSSLLRALVNAWPVAKGQIRLDNAGFDLWSPDMLGRQIGYLPQDVELFQGTIAENISRFAADPAPADIVKAARLAGVHDLILSLEAGYETDIGTNGAALSGGQRQRIALARALYGDPFLVVLDEPNASLDAEGEKALRSAVLAVKARGGVVVVASHRQSLMGAFDQILMMRSGRGEVFVPAAGRRDETSNVTPISTQRRQYAQPAIELGEKA